MLSLRRIILNNHYFFFQDMRNLYSSTIYLLFKEKMNYDSRNLIPKSVSRGSAMVGSIALSWLLISLWKNILDSQASRARYIMHLASSIVFFSWFCSVEERITQNNINLLLSPEVSLVNNSRHYKWKISNIGPVMSNKYIFLVSIHFLSSFIPVK